MTDASNSIDYFRVLPENINSYLEKGFIIYQQQCNKCREVKILTEFNKCRAKKNGYYITCKKCINKKYYWDQYKKLSQKRKNNCLELRKKAKEYRQTDRAKELITAANKRNYKKNKVKYRTDHTKWKKQNPDWYRNYTKDRHKNDPEFKLRERLRSRINFVLKKCKGQKSASTIELLGCSIEYAREHLENQFIEGMTWDNHGEWHIDHIIPCAAFDLTKEEEQRRCFHYTNLQPLWAEDNLKKGAKV